VLLFGPVFFFRSFLGGFLFYFSFFRPVLLSVGNRPPPPGCYIFSLFVIKNPRLVVVLIFGSCQFPNLCRLPWRFARIEAAVLSPLGRFAAPTTRQYYLAPSECYALAAESFGP